MSSRQTGCLVSRQTDRAFNGSKSQNIKTWAQLHRQIT